MSIAAFRHSLHEARQTIDSLPMRKARKKVIELLFPLVALIGVFLAILEPILVSSPSANSIGNTASYVTFIGNFALYFGLFSVTALLVYFIDSFASHHGSGTRLVHWLASAIMFLFLGVILSVLFVLAAVGNNVSQTLTVPVSLEGPNFAILFFTTLFVCFVGVYFFEYRALPVNEL